jgi:hypothetical protein
MTETLIVGAMAIALLLIVGAFIGDSRGRREQGMLLSIFLGPVGWIVLLFLPDTRRRCPHCASVVPVASATVCSRCTRDLIKRRPTPAPMPVPVTGHTTALCLCGHEIPISHYPPGTPFRCQSCHANYIATV